MIVDLSYSYFRCDVCDSLCFKHVNAEEWRQKHEMCGLPHVQQLSFADYFNQKLPNAAAYMERIERGWSREFGKDWL